MLHAARTPNSFDLNHFDNYRIVIQIFYSFRFDNYWSCQKNPVHIWSALITDHLCNVCTYILSIYSFDPHFCNAFATPHHRQLLEVTLQFPQRIDVHPTVEASLWFQQDPLQFLICVRKNWWKIQLILKYYSPVVAEGKTFILVFCVLWLYV